MQNIDDKIRDIKQQFRKAMNGIVAGSMREKGIEYRVNFGLTLPLVKRIAASYTPDKILAERLWNEQVRESKMLATWLYPAEEMTYESAYSWVGQIPYNEIADVCCMNLFCKLTYAGKLANECTASDSEIVKYTGYQLWNRLIINQYTPTKEEIGSLLGNVSALFCEECSVAVINTAVNSIKRVIRMQPQYIDTIKTTMKQLSYPSSIGDSAIQDILNEICNHQN